MPGSSAPDALRAGLVLRLRTAGCVFAEDEASLLLAEARTPAVLEDMVARRVAGEPLEYILGWAAFCGLRVSVSPGVFVPRRRTEVLVREAVGLLRPVLGARSVAGEDPIALDVCCGTGAIGAAILAALPTAAVVATDVDPAAVECARANVERAGGHVFEGDLFDALPSGLLGRARVVVANAPYVPTDRIGLMPREARDHERRIALDGGPDGTALHRRIAVEAPRWLAPGGHLLIESGRAQAPTTARHMSEAGFAVRIIEDDDFDATAVIGAAP